MAGLGRVERGLDRLVVAHLADQDHVGILAQRGAQGEGERLRVDLDLALVDQALLVPVQELDRVLDRHDVLGAVRVDVVDHRGQRRRLTGTGRSGDEDETAALMGDLLEHDREIELADRLDLDRDHAQHHADRAALLEDVAAEAAETRHRVGHVDLEVVLELLLLARAHDAEGHRDGVLLHQTFLIDHGREAAVDPEHRMRSDLEVEVGGALIRRQLEQVVDMHRSLQAKLEPVLNLGAPGSEVKPPGFGRFSGEPRTRSIPRDHGRPGRTRAGRGRRTARTTPIRLRSARRTRAGFRPDAGAWPVPRRASARTSC